MAQTSRLGKTATSIYESDGKTVVRYHQTEVVKFNGTLIALDSGGWRTNTTKTRMNQASSQFGLGFKVWQKDFDWFVDLPNGTTVEFDDYMTFVRYGSMG